MATCWSSVSRRWRGGWTRCWAGDFGGEHRRDPPMSRRLHQADRPVVTRYRFVDGDCPPPHGGPPVAAARGHTNLGKDRIDHRVDEVILVRRVAVWRHGRDPNHLDQRAHAVGLQPTRVCLRDRCEQHPLAAQPASRSTFRWCAHDRSHVSSGWGYATHHSGNRMTLVHHQGEVAYFVNRHADGGRP